MHPDHMTVMPASTWELARFLGGALVVLYAALEWTNRHTPSTPLRSAWAWWRRNGVGPLRLAGRVIDMLRALGYCIADVVPAGVQRGRDRWSEYLERARREY